MVTFLLLQQIGGKPTVHVQPSFLQVYNSAGRDFNQFQLQLFTLFWLVGTKYLVQFQVSVGIFVSGYKV